MDNLNNRPRKSLGFNTPKKLFLGACQKVALGT
jgi:IS30 family transposase